MAEDATGRRSLGPRDVDIARKAAEERTPFWTPLSGFAIDFEVDGLLP